MFLRCKITTFFSIVQKNLVISKKSSTFVADFVAAMLELVDKKDLKSFAQ